MFVFSRVEVLTLSFGFQSQAHVISRPKKDSRDRGFTEEYYRLFRGNSESKEFFFSNIRFFFHTLDPNFKPIFQMRVTKILEISSSLQKSQIANDSNNFILIKKQHKTLPEKHKL